ncbi:uncharacterized protein LOC119365810 isoform X1 [Triticum dicoccoides]|uniref:uncharacterized protein LOC119365810 isoform X1 n=1 Tax=Triticum dicoccoides TaxID=85692 RepID=UPI00188F8346|nr:uncharacterized protein LOC119365810 isoform X1 [Triticum dicoccoides]XP_044326238.1 uncharacterized protein LOC123046867 isoform X1 [Triticum aestivum]
MLAPSPTYRSSRCSTGSTTRAQGQQTGCEAGDRECDREVLAAASTDGQLDVIPGIVVRSLKEFVTFPRTGILTIEVTLEFGDDDIYVSTPCSYFIGLGNRMVFKQEGFSDFLQASSLEVNSQVLITFKQRVGRLVVIFNLLPQ